PGTPTATGDLLATDVDNPTDVFQVVAAGAATTNGYGTYGVTAAGVWTYTLDNSNATVQALNDTSPPLTDTFTVFSQDRTPRLVPITCIGTTDSSPSPFTLTTGIDTVLFASGTNTVFGDNATLNTGDRLTGGTGTDTLIITDHTPGPPFAFGDG